MKKVSTIIIVFCQLKNEYKTFLARKLEIESELVEVEKHELFLR